MKYSGKLVFAYKPVGRGYTVEISVQVLNSIWHAHARNTILQYNVCANGRNSQVNFF